MSKFGLEVKVGALFIVTLIVLGYFSIKVGSIRFPWEEEGYLIKVYFDDIAGLEIKAPVRLAGVRIGMVQSIELENGKARVIAEIDPSIKIHRDAEANVSQMGVMGEKFLEIISRKGVSEDYLESGDTLLGSPPTSFDQVISVVNSIGHDIKAITSSMKRVMASREGEERMSLIVENIERITRNLADVLEALLTKDNRGAYEEGTLDCKNAGFITNHPLTTLMIPPEHRAQMQPILDKLRQIKL